VIKYTDTFADLSPCGRYRYRLGRTWNAGGLRRLCWVMLNPSTADGTEDDATIRKCVGFSVRLGYDAMVVVNLFALRSRNPRALLQTADPIGPENDHHIHDAAIRSTQTICGWGVHGALLGRGAAVLRLLRQVGVFPSTLKLINGGQPGHPLFLDFGLRPVPLPIPGEGSTAMEQHTHG